jgi:uncharacterized delta-60 repeat protein
MEGENVVALGIMMRAERSGRGRRWFTSRRLVPLVLLGWAAAGCGAILGIDDFEDGAATGGQGAAGGAGGNGAGAAGSGGNGGDGGDGGTGTPDFGFSILPVAVNVPYDGTNFVGVTINRTGGFDGAVEVTVDGPPAGLVFTPATIPMGSSAGAISVGAMGALVLGSTFELKLSATSGDLVRTASVPAKVTGKPGTLDVSFNGTGVYNDSIGPDGGTLLDVMVMSDGKVMASGAIYSISPVRFVTLRVLPDGTADATFDTDGQVSIAFTTSGGEVGEAYALGEQLSGMVVVAGPLGLPAVTSDIGLVRLKDNGAEEPLFYKNHHDLAAGDDYAYDMVIAPDDKLLLVGSRNGDSLVTRFTADGSLDDTFAAPDGFLATSLSPGMDSARAMAVDGAGNIIAAGSGDFGAQSDVTLTRVSKDGVLDTTFGEMGKVILGAPGASERAVAVAVLPGGKILVAGDVLSPGGRALLMGRLNADGSPDATFGTGGMVIAPVTDGDDYAADMRVLLDGRFVIVGHTAGGSTPGPLLARFLPDGDIDPTFGTDGVATPFLGDSARITAVDLDAEEKLVVAATAENSYLSVIARIWN